MIGGVGLLTLFDSCMNGFEYVDSAAAYGKDYQQAALRISLLQLRFSRWSKNVTFVDDKSKAPRDIYVASTDESKS